MAYAVICPDGVDRLRTRWPTHEKALFDAAYFGAHRAFGCASWADDKSCPGGTHYVLVPSDPDPELAWTVDVAPA